AKSNALNRLVKKSFAAIADDIAHRPTNSSVAGIVENGVGPLLDKKLSPIVAELASIRRDPEGLRVNVENVIGYRKEIDHALERIAEIEKHLGIERKKGDLLRGASALLFPIDWPEPFGLVMIEAMACGTPVIAFRRGSVPEVIDEGVTGFIVDNE